jgi:AbrB family looped-hinge helix DNA binding protein
MQLNIDKFGRVVLPKAMRDDLGLVPGTPLKVVRTPRGIELEPITDASVLIEKEGILVHTGTALGDLNEAIHKGRNTRLDRLLRQETNE